MIADGFPLNPHRVKFRSSSNSLELRFFVRRREIAAELVDERSHLASKSHRFALSGCGVELHTVSRLLQDYSFRTLI